MNQLLHTLGVFLWSRDQILIQSWQYNGALWWNLWFTVTNWSLASETSAPLTSASVNVWHVSRQIVISTSCLHFVEQLSLSSLMRTFFFSSQTGKLRPCSLLFPQCSSIYLTCQRSRHWLQRKMYLWFIFFVIGVILWTSTLAYIQLSLFPYDP